MQGVALQRDFERGNGGVRGIMSGAAVAVVSCGVCGDECRIVAVGVEYETRIVKRGTIGDVACARTDVEGIAAHQRTVVFVAADGTAIWACHGTGFADVGDNDTRGGAACHCAPTIISDYAAKSHTVRRNSAGDDGGTGAAGDDSVSVIITYDAPDVASGFFGSANGNVVGNVAVGNGASKIITYDAVGIGYSLRCGDWLS